MINICGLNPINLFLKLIRKITNKYCKRYLFKINLFQFDDLGNSKDNLPKQFTSISDLLGPNE
jgi:hypothetical protein